MEIFIYKNLFYGVLINEARITKLTEYLISLWIRIETQYKKPRITEINLPMDINLACTMYTGCLSVFPNLTVIFVINIF